MTSFVQKHTSYIIQVFTNLRKKQKLHAVERIVKGHDDSKPWPQPIRAESAYIQPLADQSGGAMPLYIRPAFIHSFTTSVKEGHENAGLLALTRVGSHRVIQISPGFMIFFSFLGHLSMNNDVYSFGVVLLELLSGRRATAYERCVEETSVEWVKLFLCDNRRVFTIMDTQLGVLHEIFSKEFIIYNVQNFTLYIENYHISNENHKSCN
ncbi:DNA-directed RNA polymerase 2B [Artemisia annua]|uniref:DNA-directed RNA polymerase 2B n=1 Tax=Artemisia annua TaxID=35608 RepID=A0A2U1P5V1_ARTAN|nr:DNA-directed RNA polymerase 2B [Artemisia annua]